MQVHFGLDSLQCEWPRSVVCIGTFDGVHIGHQEVIRTAVSHAGTMGAPCLLATFDRNPAALLAPDKCPPSIASLESNLRSFNSLGVDIAVVLPFDRQLSEQRAAEFYDAILKKSFHAVSVVVGHDFTFGKDREGTADWLSDKIETKIVPPYLHDGVRVSSGQIRREIERGALNNVSTLLGRPFEIPGVVVEGRRLGRQLGFPTLNLARSFIQATPLDGVYSGCCETPFGRYKAAISIGIRPTIDDSQTIEAYLLDYSGSDLYGKSVKLTVIERLRDQLKFDSLDSLRQQIELDVASISNVNCM